MRVALVYDRVNKWGGAERVLLALQELFPEAPLYTSVYSKEKARWAKGFSVRPSFLQEFPLAKDAHELYPLLMPAAFESFSFDEYDLVISITSEAGKGILTKPQTFHICYCLTPTRYLWSGHEEYFSNKLVKWLSRPAIAYLKSWDKVASMRPDAYIGISEEVKMRIGKYYGRDSEVIHPPVGLFESKPLHKKRPGDYYLVVSRLVPYKRIDLAIKACNKFQLPLKIVGVGTELQKLKQLAGPTVEFLGAVPDEKLIPLYEGARALLFPGFEDFGIVMAEALGFGVPVIAYNKGGARDIIESGKSGVLFETQSVTALINAIKQSQSMHFHPATLRKRAELFSKTVFKKRFAMYIENSLQKREKYYYNK